MPAPNHSSQSIWSVRAHSALLICLNMRLCIEEVSTLARFGQEAPHPTRCKMQDPRPARTGCGHDGRACRVHACAVRVHRASDGRLLPHYVDRASSRSAVGRWARRRRQIEPHEKSHCGAGLWPAFSIQTGRELQPRRPLHNGSNCCHPERAQRVEGSGRVGTWRELPPPRFFY